LAGAFKVEPVAALDGTRRLAVLHVDGADAQPLPALGRDRVVALVDALYAAECAGGAAWCVETAAEYAKVRVQFDRPIGQFQGVKHRCADMLVAAEQCAGVAWDAAAALDERGLEAEARLAAGVAGAVAPDLFVRVAKDCIQVLGGIGFTWEHDAHLYLRRATSTRQLLGAPHRQRAAVARFAVGGVRRQLRLQLRPRRSASGRRCGGSPSRWPGCPRRSSGPASWTRATSFPTGRRRGAGRPAPSSSW